MKAQRMSKARSAERATGLRAALALYGVLCGLQSGCGDSALLIVSVGGIDPGANRLFAQARFGATQFLTTPSFTLDAASLDATARYTFGLRVHDRTDGQLSVSVATIVASGVGESQQLCLLQTEIGDVAISAGEQPTLNIDLPSLLLDGTGCNRELPIIQRARQDLVDGRTRLAIEGFGFAPGDKLLLDGDPQSFVVDASPLRMYADLPVVTAPSGARPVRVEIEQSTQIRSNAVLFVASEPWFSTPTGPIYTRTPDAAGVEIYTGVTSGDFNGDKFIDIAASGYVYKDGQRGNGFVDIFLSTGRGLSGMQRLRSPVWNLPAVAPAETVTAEALVPSKYRQSPMLDLIVAISDTGQGRGGYIVLQNDGLGHFTPTSTYQLRTPTPHPIALAHVDVNIADDPMGHLDVVMLSEDAAGDAHLSVFLSDSSGNIGLAPFWEISVGQKVSGFTALDLNDDGAADFAFIGTERDNPARPQLHVYLNYRNGKVWHAFVDLVKNLTPLAFGGAVVGTSLIDAGKIDLVASSYGLMTNPAASIQVMHNSGSLNMQPADAPVSPLPPVQPDLAPLPQIYSAGARPYGLAVVDADRDGRRDIAASLSGDLKEPTRIVVLRHRSGADLDEDLFPAGPGRQDALPVWPLPDAIGDALLLAEDVTGDTQLDLIAIVRGDGPSGQAGALWFLRNL